MSFPSMGTTQAVGSHSPTLSDLDLGYKGAKGFGFVEFNYLSVLSLDGSTAHTTDNHVCAILACMGVMRAIVQFVY